MQFCLSPDTPLRSTRAGEGEIAGQQRPTDYPPTDVKSFWSGLECRKVQPHLSHSKMSVAVQSSWSVAIRLAWVPPHSGHGRGGSVGSIVMDSEGCTVCANAVGSIRAVIRPSRRRTQPRSDMVSPWRPRPPPGAVARARTRFTSRQMVGGWCSTPTNPDVGGLPCGGPLGRGLEIAKRRTMSIAARLA